MSSSFLLSGLTFEQPKFNVVTLLHLEVYAVRLGLRQANQHFSKAIKAVRAGREVILTDRGKPIAVIKPLPQDDLDDAVIRRLEAEGLLRPALKRGPMPEPSWRPIRMKGSPLSETVREEREER